MIHLSLSAILLIWLSTFIRGVDSFVPTAAVSPSLDVACSDDLRQSHSYLRSVHPERSRGKKVTVSLYRVSLGNSYLDGLEHQTLEASVTATGTRPIVPANYLPQQKKVGIAKSAASANGTVIKDKQEATTSETTSSSVFNFPELPDRKQLMKQIKEAGTAGIVSFALVQLGFWSVSLVIVLFGYVRLEGHLPDLSDKEELSKLGAGEYLQVVLRASKDFTSKRRGNNMFADTPSA